MEIERGLKRLGYTPPKQIWFTEHHESHAASAFYPSPFTSAAIVTFDGVGEWATSSIGAGHNNEIELIEQIDFPHSLGMLYSAFTYFCGFRVNSGEYKLMGLAPYGEPVYADTIRDHLIITVAATIRNRLLTVPARLVNHSGRHRLRLPLNWPWANTFTTALQRIRNLPLLI